MINGMEKKINRTAILILIAWILITIFSGLFENNRLPRVIPKSKFELDMPALKIRNEIIKIDLDEVYRKRP